MKKIILACLLVGTMILALTACGSNSNSGTGKNHSKTNSENSGNEDYFKWDGTKITGLTDEGKEQETLVIPAKCTEIYDGLYENTVVKEIQFEGDEITFCIYTFAGCTNLSKVTLPKGLEEVPDSCFAMCSSLTEIVIPDSVTRIGDAAFQSCKELKKVVLGASVKSIGENAFGGDEKLEEITFNEGLEEVKKAAFKYCHSLKEINLKEGLKVLEQYAFARCDNLEKIYLPESLEEIDKEALLQYHETELYVKEGSYADIEYDNTDSYGQQNINLEKKYY